MRKLLFFGTLFITVCVVGFCAFTSDAETQTNNDTNKTENETVIIDTETIDVIEPLNINDTMVNVEEPETIIISDEVVDESETVEFSENTKEDVNKTEDIYDIKSQEVLEKQVELESITDKEEWFIAYKNLINEYSEWVDSPESIYDVYSNSDIYLMQRCIETETFEQDFESKVNVASVILNRLNSEKFSNDVSKVIVKGQFAFGRKKISEDTKLALEYAYMIGDTTEGALYFHSLAYRPRFNGADYIFTDAAGHHFYR